METILPACYKPVWNGQLYSQWIDIIKCSENYVLNMCISYLIFGNICIKLHPQIKSLKRMKTVD